jgi:signal transduction histidine kinase
MGSRGRSIRLRIYFLVAIPLLTMLGLFGYVAYTSVNNWLNLDRAPSLIKATSIPLTNFVDLLQVERRAAVVYESQPTAANLAAYQAAVTATRNGVASFEATVQSPATKQNATATSTAAMAKMVTDVSNMSGLRAAVAAKKISPIETLEAYSEIVADQDNVFQAQAASMTDTTASSQGLGLISAVNAREDLSEQDAVLAGALAANSLTGPDRAAFGQAAGRQFDDTQLYERLLTPDELTAFNATMNQIAPPATIQADLTRVQDAVEADVPLAAIKQQGLSPATWQLLTTTWQKANYDAATNAAASTLETAEGLAVNAKHQVWVTAAVGLAGLVLTLIVSLWLSRSINRRLNTLRRSALTLANEQLPAVVARLRRGESVDVAAEAPALRVGGDEIGQVGEAIDAVRQTAIRAAIEEARVRQGVNDMFRNLARRNQSLLQRQLSVLDSMERRATDPDVLEDLFKMDHLTTRMRRHAEGLIILSGAAPGRSWSAPVKLIDVMRGAVAEVEDYARVAVTTQSRAALSGSAVADVIHLLAELIENATTLSPPFTQVRVNGEVVANGFAIEIEDRGLGMMPQRFQELNERLATPPDINPANTEQLGLFVVGQLARRHGITVTLRPSPYGGTSAVALVPRQLLVDEGPAAITSGGQPMLTEAGYRSRSGGPAGAAQRPGGPGAPMPSRTAYEGHGPRPGDGGGAVSTPATPGGGNKWGGGPGGPGGTGGWAAMPGPDGTPGANGGSGAYPTRTPAAPAAFRGMGSGGYPAQPPAGSDPRGTGPLATGPRGTGARGDGARGDGSGPYSPPPFSEPGPGSIRVSGALRAPGAPGAPGNTGNTGSWDSAPEADIRQGDGRQGPGDVHVVTGVPVGRSAGALVPPFDVFTPIRREDSESAPAAETMPYAQPYPDYERPEYDRSGVEPTQAYSYGGEYGQAGRGIADQRTDAADQGNNDQGDSGYENGGLDGEDDYKGLPRRVRQANLAPQLRASAATAGSNGPAVSVPPADPASLSVMRNTLSAMQRGWQQGRSEAQRDGERES